MRFALLGAPASRRQFRNRRDAGAPSVYPRVFTLWVASVLGFCVGTLAAELLPIPETSLAGMEAAVQAQLAGGLAELRALATRPGLGAGELAETYGDMGRVYLAYDLVAPAEACLANARRLAPEDFRWHFLAAALYQNERRLDEALASFRAALALEPRDLAALIRTGNVHLARDEPEAARAYFERALELGGPREAALAGLGKAAAALGELDSAVRFFTTALELRPEATALHYPLAIAYRELGRIDDARRHLALRGDVEAPFPDPLAQGLSELATGAGVHLSFGHRALRQGNVDKAVEHFSRAVAANPRSAPAQQALAAALARRGDTEGAVRHYSASLALDPENPAGHYNLGTALVERGEDEQAIRHFSAALELAPDYHNARYNLATAMARNGRYGEAESLYRELLGADPTDHGTRFYLAQTLRQLGRHGEAAELLAGLVAEDPTRVRARLSLAAALAASGQADAAAEEWAAALELDAVEAPQRAQAHRALAEVLAQQHRYRESAAHYGELVALRPADEEARFGQAMALMLAESYPEARQRLEEAVAALPRSPGLAHALAQLLAACPSPEVRDGRRALDLALPLFRGLGNPLYAETVAMAYAELGSFEEAIAWQRRLILEAERAGGGKLMPRLERRLDLYESGQPCRAPWMEEGPPGSNP